MKYRIKVLKKTNGYYQVYCRYLFIWISRMSDRMSKIAISSTLYYLIDKYEASKYLTIINPFTKITYIRKPKRKWVKLTDEINKQYEDELLKVVSTKFKVAISNLK